MTAIVAIASDLHVNSTIGLCNPKHALDDGSSISPSASQLWLWNQVWLPFWERVKATAKREKAKKIYLVSLGDLGDINKHSQAQLFTINEGCVVDAMFNALEPSFGIVTEYIVVRGTEAHNGPGCFLEEVTANMLAKAGHKVLRDEATDAYSHWFLEVSFEGVNCVFAHHPGTSSSRPWTQGGGANRKAAWLTYDYYGKEWKPQVGFFGHVHHNEDSLDNHPVRAIYARPMSFYTAYDHRLGHTARGARVGAMLMVAREGQICSLEKVYHSLPTKSPVTL